MLQLRLSASPRSPHNVSSTSPKNRSKEEVDYDEDDDDDNDIEDPETLNRTLSEIIDGKRSSTSLLALLNKEDTDSESVQSSSSSDNSGIIHKGRLIRTSSLSSKTNGSDISSIPEVTCDLENGNLENSAIGQFNEVDLSAETGYELNNDGADDENQSTGVNGCRFTLGNQIKQNAGTVKQSANKGQVNQLNCDLSPKMNGEATEDELTAKDSEKVSHSSNSNKHLSNQTKHSVVFKSEHNKSDGLTDTTPLKQS